MKKTRKDKGITLIALIITIVVLLILALVTINTINGDNSLIAHSQNAGKLYKEEGENENVFVQNYLNVLEKINGEKNDEIKYYYGAEGMTKVGIMSCGNEIKVNVFSTHEDGSYTECSFNKENDIITEEKLSLIGITEAELRSGFEIEEGSTILIKLDGNSNIQGVGLNSNVCKWFEGGNGAQNCSECSVDEYNSFMTEYNNFVSSHSN